jgi:uncharacterized metal-binding protein YceD (DUF177 family)
MPDPAPATGLSLPLRLASLPRRAPHPVHLRPDAAARAALARELGILGIDRLEMTAELAAEGRAGWRLSGRLSARVTQACVATGAPVRSDLSAEVLRRWLPDPDLPTAPEAELPEDVSVEPLRPLVDAGEVLREELSLALPDWPRAAEAPVPAPEPAPEPGAATAPAARPNPFAVLAALKPAPGKPPESADD